MAAAGCTTAAAGTRAGLALVPRTVPNAERDHDTQSSLIERRGAAVADWTGKAGAVTGQALAMDGSGLVVSASCLIRVRSYAVKQGN